MISRKLAMVIAFAAGLAGAVAEAQQGNTISVPVSGLQNNTGEVRCGLFNSAASFPKNDQRFMGVEAPIANQQATCTFTNVPPGTYNVIAWNEGTASEPRPVTVPEISVFSNAPVNFRSTVLLLGDSRMAQWDLPQLSGWRVVNANLDTDSDAEVYPP